MDLSQFDEPTQNKLEEARAILSYKPNNDKMFRMHKSDSKTRIIFGGRRSGKTQWGAVECVWAGLGIHPFGIYPPPPLQIRICGMDLNAGVKGILVPTMYSWLPKSAVKKFWAEEKLLELVNGTLYDFKSYDQDLEKFEGAARDLVWMDEEPPKEIYQSNYYRTLYAGSNGKLLITCTPLHGMTWIYDDLYDNPEAVPPYVDYEHVSIFENPHLDKAAVEATLKDPAMRDSIEAAMYGRFISKTGLVYKEFDDKIHVKEPLAKVPDENMIVVGVDPHSRNPHGVIFCMLDRENVWTVFDEIMSDDVRTPEQVVNAIKAKIPGRWPPQLAVMDTYGNAEQSISGMSLKEYFNNKLGFHTIDAHKDVNQGMLQIKTLLDPGEDKLPRLYVYRNCVQTLREFRHYVWDDWARRKERRDPKEKPVKKDDHLLDALRYVVMSNIVYRHPGFSMHQGISKDKLRPNLVTGYF